MSTKLFVLPTDPYAKKTCKGNYCFLRIRFLALFLTQMLSSSQSFRPVVPPRLRLSEKLLASYNRRANLFGAVKTRHVGRTSSRLIYYQSREQLLEKLGMGTCLFNTLNLSTPDEDPDFESRYLIKQSPPRKAVTSVAPAFYSPACANFGAYFLNNLCRYLHA